MKKKAIIKNTIQSIAVVACSSLVFAAAAEPVRQISWDDLIPAHLRSDDFLSDLSEDQRDMVFWVINMMESLPERGPETEEYYQEIDEAMPTLKEAGIDIVAIMARIKKIKTSVVAELNGRNVRIPGYLLPLEISSEKVTEFLLVPYVGACIHVPPPPPNQIIHVKVLQKGGYKNETIYEPVWVTGKINATSMDKELFFVDGSANIDIGYAMQANHIEPYREQ